jgi:hypothetical protein
MTEILDFEEHRTKHANRNKLHIHYKSKPKVREDNQEMVVSSVGVTSLGDDPELVIMINQMEGGRLDTVTNSALKRYRTLWMHYKKRTTTLPRGANEHSTLVVQ